MIEIKIENRVSLKASQDVISHIKIAHIVNCKNVYLQRGEK